MFRSLVIALGLLAFAASAGGQAPPEPIVRAENIQRISPHVFVIPDGGVGGVPNVGLVVGSRAALVIDTGLGERSGAIVLAAARQAAPGRALFLVTTHVHPEHDLGAHAFPDTTTLIRSQDQVQEISESGQTVADMFRGRSTVMADLLRGAEFRKADVVFDQEHRRDLGGVTVRIMAMGANHTRGDTAVFVEPDKVLFTGDLAMKAPPVLTSPRSSVGQWLRSLDRLEELQATRLVPSHGPIGDAAYITGYRSYFQLVRDRTTVSKEAGKSIDETVATVTMELRERYPDPTRLATAIKAAYAEAR